MRLLAVDTTSARGSVALVDGERLGEVRVLAPEGHSRWVLEAATTLLRAFDLDLQNLDGLAVTVGPGSFTGLRVGMATVQGLAVGAGLPVVGRSSLEVLASQLSNQTVPVVALVDAWREEVYAAAYAGGASLQPPRAGRPEALASDFPSGCVFVGDGALRHRDTLLRLRPEARILEPDLFLAVPLARLALTELRAGRAQDASTLAPLYIRGADIRLPTT